MSFRSAPEEKARPAPVITTARTESSVGGLAQRREQVAAELRVPGVQRLGSVQLHRRGAPSRSTLTVCSCVVGSFIGSSVARLGMGRGVARRGLRGILRCGHGSTGDRHVHGARARSLERLGPAGRAAGAQLRRRRAARRRRSRCCWRRTRELVAEPGQALELIDGLLLAGGADLDPAELRTEPRTPRRQDAVPERDAFEIALTRAAIERDVPVLGICRGMQLINVALGGTLIQHLPEHLGHQQHRRVSGSFDGSDHDVDVLDDTLAMRVIGDARHATKSHHHQGVDRVGEGLRVSATLAVRRPRRGGRAARSRASCSACSGTRRPTR